MARLVLFPHQVELLKRSPPHVFLIGPPGTGKTTVLIVQGLTWLYLGHDVHVVSIWSGSRAVTIAIEHQLKETTKTTTASSRVHRHQFDFEKDGEVETAVSRLKSMSEGKQLCVIVDEAFYVYSKRRYFTEFSDQLIEQVPGMYLWSASVYREDMLHCLEFVELTTPLRSPPVVVREVMEAKQIKEYKQVLDYTALNKDQVQGLQQSAQKYWLQCIKAWYPKLHTHTYFLPPFHFNRVPHRMENITGEQVLVAQIPQGGASPTPSTATSSLIWREYQTTSSSAPDLSGPVDDQALDGLERVLHCLHELADNNQPKEVMMVISRLDFRNYLDKPSYAATSALLPRPSTLPEHLLQQNYHQGDFDVLIIHRQHGLFTLEIDNVGANFSQIKMTEQQKDDVVMKKVKEAVKQLSRLEVVLKHLTSDLMDNNITKILAMPNISSTQLLRAISRNPSDGQGLCQCLGVRSVDDALKMCLLSDQLSDNRTASDVNHIDLKDVGVWWQQLLKMTGPQPSKTETVYEHLVARFCGPATTVEVPRMDISLLGEAMFSTGEAMARLVLFPQQLELLNRSPPQVFLIGPPGTGKTTVLIAQGLNWLRLGHDVHVVSRGSVCRDETIAIEHQLKETKTTTASSRVHRHQFDFEKDEEVETAVRYLKSLSEGRQLCVIADDVSYYYSDRKFMDFCYKLIKQVPGVYLWSASENHEIRPLCLEEVKLTTPVRSPPIEIEEKLVHDYRVSDVPVPTDGPAVIRFTHRDGQSGHTKEWPCDCVECGHHVARILTELNVGCTGNSNGPPPLQYRDVLVLCIDFPTDDRLDSNGQVTTTASGLVRGLRACHVPVRVVEKGDEAAIRDTALGVGDLVTVTDWRVVRGLERKVVVVENRDVWLERLDAMSRCTSQLVLIDFKPV